MWLGIAVFTLTYLDPSWLYLFMALIYLLFSDGTNDGPNYLLCLFGLGICTVLYICKCLFCEYWLLKGVLVACCLD